MIHKTLDYKTYLDYFKGREDYIACQQEKGYFPINYTLDSYLLKKHIDGLTTLGVYVLTKQSTCNFICIDIDIPKDKLPVVNFKDIKIKYEYLRPFLNPIIDVLINEFSFSSNNLLLEDTGGRGYHIWVFFNSPVSGGKALHLGKVLKSKIEFEFEFFPKQPDLNPKRKYGNLIKLPLGEHKSYQQKSKFFTISSDKIHILESIEENIKHLKSIDRLDIAIIDKISEDNKIEIPFDSIELAQETYKPEERRLYKNDLPQLYNNCAALNTLKNKASTGIKLNYIETFHLVNVLLSVDNSLGEIHKLIKSSFQEDYSEDITNREINNLQPFQPSLCTKLQSNGICKGYCKEELQIRNEDPLLYPTNPLRIWLDPLKIDQKKFSTENLLQNIASTENIKIAYARLKEYCKFEDGLFYDEFDFSFFEEQYEEHIKLISLAISNNLPIPTIKYEFVNVPKKINEKGEMTYRKMAYSSVFDQIIIQAIFNIIAPLLEENFQDCSYGYRLNVGDMKSNKIFEDWKDKYPQFRSNVLNKLREPNIKYYVCCDIKGYYDNIRKDLIITQLRGIINDNKIFRIIKKTIESYSFENNDNLGLPQGPVYSRSLANLYLNEFDIEICKKADYYFRYVDDFFMLFDSKQKAEEVLEWTNRKLGTLGLKLSSDKDKEAIILDANDERIIIDKIDSFRYGIFEEFKFLPYLKKSKIEEFYKTVSQQVITSDESNDINNLLPSLIYLYSKDINNDTETNLEVIEIIEKLAESEKFFPKKTRRIFSRIIDLYSKTNRDWSSFYSNLEDTHQVYFLLSLYEKFQVEPEIYQDCLKRILLQALDTKNKFLKGFGVSICKTHCEILKIEINDKEIINDIVSSDNEFLGMKYFKNVDYFELLPEEKNKISNYFKPSSNYLLKLYFLNGIKKINLHKEVDSILFKNILSDNYFLLHTEVCKIISLFQAKNTLFERLIEFIVSEKPKYKVFLIDTLGRFVFEKYSNQSISDFENLKEIYRTVDDEISSRILEVLARINDEYIITKPSPFDDYVSIDSYNECRYYKSEKKGGDYIESIPYYKLNTESPDSFENFVKDTSVLAEYSVIPKNTINYKSYKDSIIIEYAYEAKQKSLDFSVENPLDCYNAILLLNNINKKANAYYKQFNIYPKVCKENLVVLNDMYDIMFIKLGFGLTDRYYIKSSNIDNKNPVDFAKNLYLFIHSLFFKDNSDWKKFEKESKVDISLFLCYFLEKLNFKGFSVTRLDYLTAEIKKVGYNNNQNICYLYFTEILRNNLSVNCDIYTNWIPITKSILDTYERFAITYNKIKFRDIEFNNKLFLNQDMPRNLHYLTQIIINLNLNIPTILPFLKEKRSVKIFRLLNYFSTFCIELQSLNKILLKEKKEIPYLKQKQLKVKYEGLNYNLSLAELDNINKMIKLHNSNVNSIFKETVYYSLKEIAFLCILKVTDQVSTDNSIELISSRGKSRIYFEKLIETYLIEIPEIEDSIIPITNDIIFTLKRNFYFLSIEDDEINRLEIKIIETIRKIRFLRIKNSSYRFKRKFKPSGFGVKLSIDGLIKKNKHEVSLDLSKGIPLTNLFPASPSLLTYDTFNKEIINTVIPNERILELIQKLQKGKLFGVKISYLYSEKLMLLWDILIFIFFFSLSAYITLIYDQRNINTNSNSFLHSTLWPLRNFLWLIPSFFIGKIFLLDISYWFKRFPNVINMFRIKRD